MREPSNGKAFAASQSFYRLLLKAYPSSFRSEYGSEMRQVFRDLCREPSLQHKPFGLVRVWIRTLLDLARTAPAERLENLKKEFDVLKALRTFALAIIVYALVILVFGKLLMSGKPYLPYAVGAMIDSLMSIGIAFNFIVLILVTTKLSSPVSAVRAACVSVILLLAAFLIFVPAGARPNAVAMTTIVLSLLFWFGAHRLWARKKELSLQT